MKKPTIIIISFAIIAILSVAGFWKWENTKNAAKQQAQNKSNDQPSDETIDWQSLDDDKIGISIKFPMNWESKIVTSSDKSVIGVIEIRRKGAIKGIDYDPHGIPGGDYLFVIKVRDQNSSAAKKFSSYLNNAKEISTKVDFGNKITLPDGTEALKNIIEGPGKTFDEQRGNNITYSFLKNGKYYEIAIVYDGNGMSGGVGEKIFSTLKFIK